MALIHYWKFDEADPTGTLADSAGSANGTGSVGLTADVDVPTLTFSDPYSLTSVNGTVTYPSMTLQVFTITCWAKLPDTASNQLIVYDGLGSSFNVYLVADGAGGITMNFQDQASSTIKSISVGGAAGSWGSFGWAYTSSKDIQFWYNGALQSTQSTSFANFGANNFTTTVINNNVDDLRIFNTILDEQDFIDLYNGEDVIGPIRFEAELGSNTIFNSVLPEPLNETCAFDSGFNLDFLVCPQLVDMSGGFFVDTAIDGAISFNQNFDVEIYCQTALDSPLSKNLSDGSLDLYLCGAIPVTGSMDLYTTGAYRTAQSSLNLYVQSGYAHPTTGTVDLFAWSAGSNSGILGALPLYMSGSVMNRTLNLSLIGPNSDNTTALLNLSLNGAPYSLSANIPLFLENDISGSTNSLNLYVSGDGISLGAYPTNSALNLYIERNPAGLLNLYLAAPGTPISSGVSLYMDAHVGLEEAVDLAIPYVVGKPTKPLKLYVNGW